MNKRKEEIRKLAFKIYLDRGKADGQDCADWYKAERRYRLYKWGWGIISWLTFLISLAIIYFNKNLENILWGRAWFFILISILAGVGFYGSAWKWIEEETCAPVPEPMPINEMKRAIHEARYSHLNAEITRYRDLVWKVTAFAWAIYYALIRFAEGFMIQTNSAPQQTKLQLPVEWFLIFLIITAFFATIFHEFCEIMAVRNQERRRNLETVMGLIDPNWAHQATLEHPRRLGFIFSVVVFGLLIWAPPFIMLILSASPK